MTGPRVKYIVDHKGRRIAVVLPIADYNRLLRELQDLRDALYVDKAEASAEGFVEVSDLRRCVSTKGL